MVPGLFIPSSPGNSILVWVAWPHVYQLRFPPLLGEDARILAIHLFAPGCPPLRGPLAVIHRYRAFARRTLIRLQARCIHIRELEEVSPGVGCPPISSPILSYATRPSASCLLTNLARRLRHRHWIVLMPADQTGGRLHLHRDHSPKMYGRPLNVFRM